MNQLKLERPSVSICVVNYNGLKYLKNCFDSIVRSLYPFEKMEIILVDNASKGEDIDYVRSNYSWVKVVALDKNYGFAMANNIGAKDAKGEYLIFLNNDAVVTPNWLNELVDLMEKDNDIDVVGSKILLLEPPGKINSAGANITFNGCGYDIGFLDDDSEKYNVGGYRGCVCAAAMMLRRKEFLVFGCFDEDYFMYFERCKVYVAPLRYGAGVKRKIIGAMSYGIPVVTTTIVDEGLNLSDGENILISDDRKDLIESIQELYSDKNFWYKIHENALKHVEENFSHRVFLNQVKKMMDFLER